MSDGGGDSEAEASLQRWLWAIWVFGPCSLALLFAMPAAFCAAAFGLVAGTFASLLCVLTVPVLAWCRRIDAWSLLAHLMACWLGVLHIAPDWSMLVTLPFALAAVPIGAFVARRSAR